MQYLRVLRSALVLAASVWFGGSASAQLLSNLQAFGSSVSVIDPEFIENDPGAHQQDGPKELAVADFDLDGFPDIAASKVLGKIAVVYGRGGKDFDPAEFLEPGVGELRGIAAGDFNGDGRPDIVAAAPFEGKVVVFLAEADRQFAAPLLIDGWPGVRAVLPLDLDGNGVLDMLVAGPGARNAGTEYTSAAAARPLINDGAGGFALGGELQLTGDADGWLDSFPRPLFTMAALDPLPGTSDDRAVLTHPNSKLIWIVRLGVGGDLEIESSIPALLSVRSLSVGPVLSQNGAADLVQAARDENQILIRPSNGSGGFLEDVAQRIYVPGSPRSLAVADVNGDGWLDVLAVLREFDRVVTFHNKEGVLELAAEAPVGVSPRDLEAVDFNSDGLPDLAVSNRRSDDISILLTQSGGGGFERLDSVYPVDGGVTALLVEDLDGDGRSDVIQAHLLTKELSVRRSLAGGDLADPVFFQLESQPLALRPGDLDGDGNIDLMVVHSSKNRPGVSVIIGDGMGGFRAPLFLPSADRMFSLALADFDGDGVDDAAVGRYDCRLTMYKGSPDGTFEYIKTGLFTYEARAMVAGDFDQDGDTDLAGASALGKMTVIENDGTLLDVSDPNVGHESTYSRSTYNAPVGKGRIKSMVTLDWNGDADTDLAINSDDGVSVFVGGDGLSFEALPEPLPGTRGASDVVRGDFDGDGVADLATACRLFSCVVILRGLPDAGGFELAAVAPVPSSEYIASGDVDGDGLDDLVGSGEVLWVALSGTAPKSASGALGSSRQPIPEVVINELLASNLTLQVGAEGKTPDLLELYNGRAQSVIMDGWTLTYQKNPSPEGEEYPPVDYTFPAGTEMQPGARLVLWCDNEVDAVDGVLHTPFKLSREGACVTLKDSAGEMKDEVAYELQEPDLSLGRFTDGAELMSSLREPDVGAPNFTFTSIEPDFRSVSVLPESLIDVNSQRQPRLLVKVRDEVGVFTLDAIWRDLDSEQAGRVGLFDDGFHDDGEALDGVFGGAFQDVRPGMRVEYYLTATNLIDKDQVEPGDPVFALPGQMISNYSFQVPLAGAVPLAIEISEVQPGSGGVDETGENVDFIEVRNVSDAPIDLNGLALRDSAYASSRTHSLSGTLAPGGYAVFYADSDPGEGAAHMPFKLQNNGDAIWLVGMDDFGVVSILDRVRPPEDLGAASWSRLMPGGDFVSLPATQGGANVPNGQLHTAVVRPDGGQPKLQISFSAPLGKQPVLEVMQPGSAWMPTLNFTGDGFEQTVEVAFDQRTRLFRVRNQ